MISAQFWGGLGNQMFQVAAAVALAHRNADTAVFNFDDWRRSTQGNSPIAYRANLFENLLPTNKNDWEIYRDTGVDYRPVVYRPNLQLRGLFQSVQYFEDCQELVRTLFAPPAQTIEQLQMCHRRLLDAPNCAVHVRRGDYLGRSSYCQVLDFSYYLRAIELFPGYKFSIFSDDLNYCRSVFIGERFNFISTDSEVEDLYLMSLHEHQIIANSTFSWWGAWLNSNPYKRVVAPSKWSKRRNIDNSIYMDSMIKI